MNANNPLSKKIDNSLNLLCSACGSELVEVCFSGGKDSEVILELAKMAGIKFRAIYKNTTIDPPGTIKHCLDKGVEVLSPKIRFFDLVKKSGLPTRRARFCCSYLKEYKVLDIAIQGVRRCESVARQKRYSSDDPVICRFYGSKKNHVNVILPILDWSDEDVSSFIAMRGIRCHPLYYDQSGSFCVSRRLGCIGCPLQSDAGKADYLRYPKMFRELVFSVCEWWENHPNAKSHNKFRSPYGLIANDLFYRSYNDWLADDYTLFGYEDWKHILEKYFSVKL